MNINLNACSIIKMLQAKGHSAYVVGGCVRDGVMGLEPHDWDLCTSAEPSQVKAIAAESGMATIDSGIEYGTVTVLLNGEEFEITTYRTDGLYLDGRHPEAVTFTDLVGDLGRRDFTINAIAYDGVNIIDPFNGVADIADGVIRTVGDAKKRFQEDALRVLRAIRFESRFGFSIEAETKSAMAQHIERLDCLSRERVGTEFRKIVCGKYAAQAIRDNLVPMTAIIPKLAEMVSCQQNNPYHYGTVFEHTMDALEHYTGNDEMVQLALFFHDFGKPVVKTTDDRGDHFYGHQQVSAEVCESTMKSLRFTKNEIDTVVQLVAFHDIDFVATPAAVKRLLNRFGEQQLRRLIEIRECDAAAHTDLASGLITAAMAFATVLDQVIAEQGCFCLKNLALNGNDLIAAGFRPGPQFGQILNTLLDNVIENKLPNQKGALLSFARGSF